VSIAKGLSKKSPDPLAVAAALEQLSAALRILEDRLHGAHLLSDDFTVGDLNLASILRQPGETGISGIDAIDLAPSQMSHAGWIAAARGRRTAV
jgi:glutathione S-transferase